MFCPTTGSDIMYVASLTSSSSKIKLVQLPEQPCQQSSSLLKRAEEMYVK